MPLLDDDLNAVGCVMLENRTNGNYSRNFMLIDFATHTLRLYPEEAEFASDLSKFQVEAEINCQYITKVNPASTRPKVLNCLDIVTTTGSYLISVDSLEERDEWIDSIRKASMRQGGKPQIGTHKPANSAPAGYRTKVVGGVVQKTPISTTNGDRACNGAEGVSGRQADGAKMRHRGFPRIIKAGHGIKQGAVVKNWKRRFFVLTEISLSYYKSIEELDPIKSISVGEVTSVLPGSKEATGKEHLFEVITPNRTFLVQVETKDEIKGWVKSFNDLLGTVRPTIQQHGQVTQGGSSETNDSDDGDDGIQISPV